MKDNILQIEDGWFVYGADFDCDEPYIVLANNDTNEEKRVNVPEQLAYYLRTHWCGSQRMHDLIYDKGVNSTRYKIKEALGIKT